MTRIPEWQDLSELGNTASLQAAGHGFGVISGVSGANMYRDVAGNGGNYCIDVACANGIGLAFKKLATPVNEFYWRMHWKQNFQDTRDRILQWNRTQIGGGENEIGTLRIDTSNRLVIYSGGTLIATSTNSIIDGVYYTIEIHLLIGNSGTIEVKVNGTSVGWIPATTADTQPGSDTTVDAMYLAVIASNNGSHHYYYDDFCADTAGWVGDGIKTILSPTGAGAFTQLTPSAGSNWDCVNEIPPSDADYVEADVVNLEDTYQFSNLPSNVDSVNDVCVVARVVKAGSTINNSYLVTRVGSTNYESAAIPLPTTAEVHHQIMTVNPNTSGVWTKTDVDGAEFGIRFDT